MDPLLQQLQACLASEQNALVDGDIDRLDSIRQVKNPLLRELNDAVRAPLSGSARLRVAELKRVNDLNAALVAARFAASKARADALIGATHAALYGAAGDLQPATPPRAAAAA